MFNPRSPTDTSDSWIQNVTNNPIMGSGTNKIIATSSDSVLERLFPTKSVLETLKTVDTETEADVDSSTSPRESLKKHIPTRPILIDPHTSFNSIKALYKYSLPEIEGDDRVHNRCDTLTDYHPFSGHINPWAALADERQQYIDKNWTGRYMGVCPYHPDWRYWRQYTRMQSQRDPRRDPYICDPEMLMPYERLRDLNQELWAKICQLGIIPPGVKQLLWHEYNVHASMGWHQIQTRLVKRYTGPLYTADICTLKAWTQGEVTWNELVSQAKMRRRGGNEEGNVRATPKRDIPKPRTTQSRTQAPQAPQERPVSPETFTEEFDFADIYFGGEVLTLKELEEERAKSKV